MEFRFTLIHPESNTRQRISAPDGWSQAVLSLKRDKEFYSLIEFFDGSFIFYGDNGIVNGGIHFIENLEATYGPDVEIQIFIEGAPDNKTFTEEIFSGQLDLSLGERLEDNKYRIPIIRDNFWAKFNSRWQTPVDIQSTTDLDGNPVSDDLAVTITLLDQKIKYFSEMHEKLSITYPDGFYYMLNFSTVVRDDIPLFSIPRDGVVDQYDIFLTLGLFEAPWNGEYTINVKFSTAFYNLAMLGNIWSNVYTPTGGRPSVVIAKVGSGYLNEFGSGLGALPQYTDVTDGPDSWREFDISISYTLSKGEQLSIAVVSPEPLTVFGEDQLTWLTVDLATTGPITLSGEQTIDGTMTSTSRVLVKNQGNKYENGIYDTGAGAWTRASDMNIPSEFMNVSVYISNGSYQSDTSWNQTEVIANIAIDAQTWVITNPSSERDREFPGYSLGAVDNFIKITANTVFPATTSEGFLIHDAAAAILNRYGLNN